MIEYLRVGRRLSAAQARNLGAQAAAKEYVLFLDSDNWLSGAAAHWPEALTRALAAGTDLVVLKRGEEGRMFAGVPEVNRWNFSRHCIEWNLVWSRRHFFKLGGLDEECCTGSSTLAQAGEAFDLCFRHFDSGGSTVYVPNLVVGHPSLDATTKSVRRQWEYAYGANFVVARQLRRKPSLLSLYWWARVVAGFGADAYRGLSARSLARARLQVGARWAAVCDGAKSYKPRRGDA
jgi:hypothetical protein